MINFIEQQQELHICMRLLKRNLHLLSLRGKTGTPQKSINQLVSQTKRQLKLPKKSKLIQRQHPSVIILL